MEFNSEIDSLKSILSDIEKLSDLTLHTPEISENRNLNKDLIIFIFSVLNLGSKILDKLKNEDKKYNDAVEEIYLKNKINNEFDYWKYFTTFNREMAILSQRISYLPSYSSITESINTLKKLGIKEIFIEISSNCENILSSRPDCIKAIQYYQNELITNKYLNSKSIKHLPRLGFSLRESCKFCLETFLHLKDKYDISMKVAACKASEKLLLNFFFDKLKELSLIRFDEELISLQKTNASLYDLLNYIPKKIYFFESLSYIQNHSLGYFKTPFAKYRYQDFINKGKKIIEEFIWYDLVFDPQYSEKMIQLKEEIECYAKTNFHILITGERGTGKDLVANAIYKIWSNTKTESVPFIKFNTAGLSSLLADSILFGHKKGAFTGATENKVGLFQQANGGVLFLDEIGALPVETQAKILRAIENQEVIPIGENVGQKISVRIIAATNESLDSGRFRQDLKDRLSQLVIKTPSLNSRWEDIPLIALHIAQNEGHTLSEKELIKLAQYDYSGNVRELKNRVLQLLVKNSNPQKEIETLLEKTLEEFILEYDTFADACIFLNNILDSSGKKKKSIPYVTLKLWYNSKKNAKLKDKMKKYIKI